MSESFYTTDSSAFPSTHVPQSPTSPDGPPPPPPPKPSSHDPSRSGTPQGQVLPITRSASQLRQVTDSGSGAGSRPGSYYNHGTSHQGPPPPPLPPPPPPVPSSPSHAQALAKQHQQRQQEQRAGQSYTHQSFSPEQHPTSPGTSAPSTFAHQAPPPPPPPPPQQHQYQTPYQNEQHSQSQSRVVSPLMDQQHYQQQQYHLQQQHQPPPLDSRWLPDGLADKSTADLQPLLNNPELLTALAHQHPSYKTSLEPLEVRVAANSALAQQVLALETQVRQLRDQTGQLLINHTSLQTQWRRKQGEMDDALSPWGPRAMYQRLVASIVEQEALLKAVYESFLEGTVGDAEFYGAGNGKASEKEVTEWIKRIKEGTTLLERRREMRARWDEGRVGGWR